MAQQIGPDKETTITAHAQLASSVDSSEYEYYEEMSETERSSEQ